MTQAPSPSPATAGRSPVPPTAPTRRDRLRAATMEEITATARRLLVEQGPEAMSLRAIAREMGMTAPGLYRYYSSREELLRHVIATIFRELSGDVQRAIDEVTLSAAGAAVARGNAAPEQVRRHLTLKMVAACRAFRRWGLSHKDEFTLLFGVPLPGLDDGRFDVAEECALEFAGTFYALFIELWNATHFPVPGPAEIDEGLRAQLGRFRAHPGHRRAGRRAPGVPALLDAALRRRGDGDLRPPGVRARRPGPDVRVHAGRPGPPGGARVPAASGLTKARPGRNITRQKKLARNLLILHRKS